MFGVQPSGPRTVCSMHHQNSSSFMPFQANTGVPAAATAAAAWSWVEKILQDDQRTVAPRCSRVWISTAVWMVMCRQPAMRAPASGLAVAIFPADGHQARHFVLGHGDLLAAPFGEGDVFDLIVLGVGHGGLL